MYRTKFHADRSVDRLKGHLVSQGYTQVPNFDFNSIFSPVIKASTIHIVLSLAVLRNWVLHQLDVKNAFLNGFLSETIFMEQPLGFVDSRYPNHVCRLLKALYGLKQALRARFQRFSDFVTRLGFACSHADTSLFVLKKGTTLLY